MQENKKGRKDKSGIPLVDVAYRRAKAIKAGNKAQEAGKKIKKIGRKATQPQSRTEEMQELFQTDMSERRLKKTVQRAGQKAKSSFKSKSRYGYATDISWNAYLLAALCVTCDECVLDSLCANSSPHTPPPNYT